MSSSTELRTEEMLLNVGPQHPSTHGVFRLIVKIDGETITEAIPVIGYLHRGTEKLAENLNYTQIIPYTDRMDYISAMSNNYMMVHTVETMMGLEIPERAEYLRVIVLELQRVASHLLWFGTYLLDLGALSPLLYAFVDREKILAFFNELSGARLTYNYMRVGGVKWDAPEGWIEKVKEFVPYMRKQIQDYHTLVTGNEVLINRLKGIGVITQEDAINYSLSGVLLRSTGIKWDLRKDEPYSIYDRFQFEVPTETAGDCFARYKIRLREMEESLNIVEQAIEQFPKEGEIMAKVPRVLRTPQGEAFTRIEAPRGEIGCYISSNGKDKPYRIKFRRPSFANLQVLPKLVKGQNVADMVAILGSIDIVLGEVDG
ncbi:MULTISPECIES: NADH-quinone oxidoreductase subunit D [Aneurinibacillus]|jgi:NADH-quinone oxidoreductase subunit D|uniref:NADH-quinone oxidoreductase subunit D n=1 Tax=Aneurinibacillus danicus TaxID=267746 RepID=A0A511VB14_9BACL|nr:MULTISPECIES: NADH-quinone oxidoreductase subunit D [Aneurinibacillus]GEN34432.1 NADH-quinone oxidoreductase subunit D [Aneurinibacillus danicus]